MEQKQIEAIRVMRDRGISRAGITSCLFLLYDLKGIDYMTARKYVIKELERIK